jgi:hypothetical protein
MVRRTYKKKENNNLRMSGKKSGVSVLIIPPERTAEFRDVLSVKPAAR